MASRLILLPNMLRMAAGPDGRPVEVHTPDTFGIAVQDTAIKSDYRDCAKVQVTAPPKVLDDLHQRSREHFGRLWGKPAQPNTDT